MSDIDEDDEKAEIEALLPDFDQILQRARAAGGDLHHTEAQTTHLRELFDRFQLPQMKEVHRDSVINILQQLGYPHLNEEEVKPLIDKATSCDTLFFEDILAVMSSYAELEKARLQEMFAKFDENGNGKLETDEVYTLLKSMGFLYLRGMVKEAIVLVDLDGNGTLNCEELALLMHLCRHTQGFAKDDVVQMSHIFRRQQLARRAPAANCLEDGDKLGEKELPVEHLYAVLKAYFGPQLKAKAQALAKQREQMNGAGITFAELLGWAAQMRDTLFQEYRETFDRFDLNKNGVISMDEMRQGLLSIGYTMSLKAIQEIISSVQREGEWHESWNACEPSLDAFMHFMHRLQRTEGFTASELREINLSFQRFDEDGSRDIDAVELNDMLHNLGHETKYDEVQLLIHQITASPTGRLDFREYVRFMRMHRESELKHIREIYNMNERDQDLD